MKKNKKMLIISGIVLVLVILIIAIVVGKNMSDNSQESKGTTARKSNVEMSSAFEISDVEKSNLDIAKTKNVKIASKYAIGSNVYKLDANVNFMETSGELIYVREDYSKLNIFQTSYKINKYKDKNSQVSQYMDEFERMCTSYLGVEMDEELEGTLYGESKETSAIPLEESIYYEERLYSKTYTVKDELDETETSYDINFYKSDESLVCEFVYIIK